MNLKSIQVKWRIPRKRGSGKKMEALDTGVNNQHVPITKETHAAILVACGHFERQKRLPSKAALFGPAHFIRKVRLDVIRSIYKQIKSRDLKVRSRNPKSLN